MAEFTGCHYGCDTFPKLGPDIRSSGKQGFNKPQVTSLTCQCQSSTSFLACSREVSTSREE
eukprot:m.173685 g.173685  ORF g.173685 m.173685 type:complete len:61 (-) comp25255_c3_seq5:341-523(-)